MAAEALLLALAAACAPQGAPDAAARAGAALAAGDPARSLEAANQIPDPLTRAEWRFHILHTSGDLPAALAAARDGLELQPDHPGLLVNATVCALALSHGKLAASLAQRLEAAAPANAPELRAQASDLLARANALGALERAGERAVVRARGTVLVSLAGGIALLLVLTLKLAPLAAPEMRESR